MEKQIRKILVVVLDNLGDAVMATAVLKPLKRLYPQAQIGFWTKKYAGDLFWDQSTIDAVHACDPFWDKAPGHEKGQWPEFLKTFWDIRRARYDLALVLNSEWRRAGFCFLAGIPVRVGLDRRKSQLFLTRTVPVSKEKEHFIDDHLSLLRALGGSPSKEDSLPRLELNLEEKKLWGEWSKKTGWQEKTYVAIHPFSGDVDKTWPIDRWTELLQNIVSERKTSRFFIFCGPSEEAQLRILVSALPSENVQFASAESLSKVKALLGHAAALIGGDSGPGHVAAALGIPVLSLFGKTDPGRSRPSGHAPLRILQCHPIREMAVSEVQQAYTELMEMKTTAHA